jgi:hypothetical protein
MTPSLNGLDVTLSMNDTKHKNTVLSVIMSVLMLSVEFHFLLC